MKGNKIRMHTLEDPEEIILTETSRFDLKKSVQLPLLPQLGGWLPDKSLQNNSHQCIRSRRLKTESYRGENHKELRHLRGALLLGQSDLLQNLKKQIKNMESLNLTQGGAVMNIRYPGHIKIPTVHNDYHCSKTNAGYSRNKYGGIYPK